MCCSIPISRVAFDLRSLKRVSMPASVKVVSRERWRAEGPGVGERPLPAKMAIAVTYNGGTYAS
jgi:hypothetical protein